jgi:hypothetical protein
MISTEVSSLEKRNNLEFLPLEIPIVTVGAEIFVFTGDEILVKVIAFMFGGKESQLSQAVHNTPTYIIVSE